MIRGKDFPGCITPTGKSYSSPRWEVDLYWQRHIDRAQDMALGLARLSGPPRGWSWQISEPKPVYKLVWNDELKTGEKKQAGTRRKVHFRTPPLPYNSPGSYPDVGHCHLCARPIFKLGWTVDWDNSGLNKRASWHAACKTAFYFWTKPNDWNLPGYEEIANGQADHIIPLWQVWEDHRETSWPNILKFWGSSNLELLSIEDHKAKTRLEAGIRAERRREEAIMRSGSAEITKTAL